MPCYLVMVDDTTTGERALEYALGLAQSRPGTALVVLTLRPPGIAALTAGLADARQALCQRFGAALRTGQVLDGGEVPEQTLTRSLRALLKQYGASLLIAARDATLKVRRMETHARQTWARLLWRSPCPLVVVSSNWDAGTPPRHAMVAADGLPVYRGQAALAANDFLRSCRSSATVVYVTPAAHAARWAAVPPALKVEPYAALLTGLTAVTALQRHHPQVREGLLKATAALQADFLIYVARQDVSSALLFNRHDLAAVILATTCPVMILGELD
jgi:hypothetical protein